MNLDWHQLTDDELNDEAFDFDKTIAHTSDTGDYLPLGPIDGAREALKAIEASGKNIVIFTARHWSDKRNIRKWCEHYDIPVHDIVCGKLLFRHLTDDRAIEFDVKKPAESWDRVRSIILKNVDGKQGFHDKLNRCP